MPAGDTREKYERKLRCATERQTQLTDRQGDFDGVALADSEFDKRRLTAALTEATTWQNWLPTGWACRRSPPRLRAHRKGRSDASGRPFACGVIRPLPCAARELAVPAPR